MRQSDFHEPDDWGGCKEITVDDRLLSFDCGTFAVTGVLASRTKVAAMDLATRTSSTLSSNGNESKLMIVNANGLTSLGRVLGGEGTSRVRFDRKDDKATSPWYDTPLSISRPCEKLGTKTKDWRSG